MSGHIWEEIVETYLTINRGVLVSPQYEINGEKWSMNPDFLAIDFPAHHVWFVEVTSGYDTHKIVSKAGQFQTEIVPRLKKQLAELSIVTDASGWKFGFWAFARKTAKKNLLDNIARYVDSAKVEALEDVAFQWEFWDKRRAEENSTAAAS